MRRLSGLCGKCLVFLVALIAFSAVWAAQEIRVAAYYFPPYVHKAEGPGGPGLLASLLTAMNASQKQFKFIMVPTSTNRRFLDLQQGRADISLFENPEWGWGAFSNHVVDMGLEDAEVFVARKVAGRTQEYFSDLSGKSLVVFASYHYRFANFNNDPAYLLREFNAQVGYSHESNLMMMLRKRVDMVLMTRSYIDSFLSSNPSYIDQVLVSERLDQVYRHQAVLRDGAAISPGQFSEIYEALRKDGALQKIFADYRIKIAAPAAGAAQEQ